MQVIKGNKGDNKMSDSEQNFAEQSAKEALGHLLKDNKNKRVFIDTCSLLDNHAADFWVHAAPYIKENPIIVTERCYEELKKHAKNKNKPELALKAQNALRCVLKLMENKYVLVYGDKNTDPAHADALFQTVFYGFRSKYKLLLITQDNNLAKDIVAMNNSLSSKGYPVYVRRINKYGYLSKFNWDTDNKKHINPPATITKITPIEDKLLKISHLPKEGEIVYSASKQAIQLRSTIASGGEGIIYEINASGFVAKIYNREKLTVHKHEKIKLMLKKKIDCQGVCSPKGRLFNEYGEFVGYYMHKASGKELQKSIFIKPLFLKCFPDWKKRDTVELCLTILKKIQYLHKQDIIIGDINPANILVTSPKEVCFVDVDSYQIDGFPCPVGTNNYTAPEIQKKNFSSFLRTIGNERFAVATLLFMIMLPGKPPYSQQGGEDPVTNIINMDFSYPFGELSNKKTPDGPWRFIWSHLTYDIKDAFYNTFQKGGKYSTETTRLSDDKWIELFSHYLEILDNGTYGQQDKMSEELYPTRYKKNPNVKYITCSLCLSEVPDFQCYQGICKECLDRGEIYTCKKCGKQMKYTNYQKYVKGYKKHEICPDCYKHGNEIYGYLLCADCDTAFPITNNEKEYYDSRGFDFPKRCPQCRAARKQKRQTQQSQFDIPDDFFDNFTKTEPEKKKSGCFLTTVVCEYLNKEDDCFELNLLREYRDNWLQYQEGGAELIKEYYANAPKLVEKMKKSPNFEHYCQCLWDNYLTECIYLIVHNKYEECRNTYISMYKYLENALNGGQENE